MSRGSGAIVSLAACSMLFAFACSDERQAASSGNGEPTIAAAEALRAEPTGAATRRLERNGVSIIVPAGWDGRILFRDSAGSWGVVFQVASFELPPNEGFEPPRELPPGEEDPITAMGGGDVLVAVVSDAAGGEQAPATIALDELRFLPGARVPRGHAAAERSFCYGERCIRIEVDFGARAPASTLRNQVDAVLSSLVVEQALHPADAKPNDDSPRGCPRENWPGPWTACAEADWVRRLVQTGGYRVVGETGSALVAGGNGRSFYVWTTRAARHPAAIADAAGDWRRLAVVDGVAVYGDDRWRFWEAQGFVFWVQEGPTGDAIIPSAAELARLIEASVTTLPPPE